MVAMSIEINGKTPKNSLRFSFSIEAKNLKFDDHKLKLIKKCIKMRLLAHCELVNPKQVIPIPVIKAEEINKCFLLNRRSIKEPRKWAANRVIPKIMVPKYSLTLEWESDKTSTA